MLLHKCPCVQQHWTSFSCRCSSLWLSWVLSPSQSSPEAGRRKRQSASLRDDLTSMQQIHQLSQPQLKHEFSVKLACSCPHSRSCQCFDCFLAYLGLQEIELTCQPTDCNSVQLCPHQATLHCCEHLSCEDYGCAGQQSHCFRKLQNDRKVR